MNNKLITFWNKIKIDNILRKNVKFLVFLLIIFILSIFSSLYISNYLFLEAITYIRLDVIPYIILIFPIILLSFKEDRFFWYAFFLAGYSCAPMILDNMFFFITDMQFKFKFMPRITTDTQFYLLTNIAVQQYQLLTIVYFIFGMLILNLANKGWRVSLSSMFVLGIYQNLIVQKIIEWRYHYCPIEIYAIAATTSLLIGSILTAYFFKNRDINRFVRKTTKEISKKIRKIVKSPTVVRF